MISYWIADGYRMVGDYGIADNYGMAGDYWMVATIINIFSVPEILFRNPLIHTLRLK
jgi:hypothetical protein